MKKLLLLALMAIVAFSANAQSMSFKEGTQIHVAGGISRFGWIGEAGVNYNDDALNLSLRAEVEEYEFIKEYCPNIELGVGLNHCNYDGFLLSYHVYAGARRFVKDEWDNDVNSYVEKLFFTPYVGGGLKIGGNFDGFVIGATVSYYAYYHKEDNRYNNGYGYGHRTTRGEGFQSMGSCTFMIGYCFSDCVTISYVGGYEYGNSPYRYDCRRDNYKNMVMLSVNF